MWCVRSRFVQLNYGTENVVLITFGFVVFNGRLFENVSTKAPLRSQALKLSEAKPEHLKEAAPRLLNGGLARA